MPLAAPVPRRVPLLKPKTQEQRIEYFSRFASPLSQAIIMKISHDPWSLEIDRFHRAMLFRSSVEICECRLNDREAARTVPFP